MAEMAKNLGEKEENEHKRISNVMHIVSRTVLFQAIFTILLPAVGMIQQLPFFSGRQ